MLSGAYLQPSEFDPPRHVWRQWFDSGGGALLALARMEAQESYAFTDYTRGSGFDTVQHGLTWQRLLGGGVSLR